ncbi:hypothetical protein [Hansschlegelia zhihuaiae]|uniref:Uncharacterized protein n=1 Tax=Hansschlegelia zhihuaiae TaxID=405005 RepID=A0A4Q0M3J9_9HYPH|nr:hypothetical protein [Hansschlegelia zhihuaiae]RXF67425.1 hypothetical protein EK403_21360 [Hansschlegelia zhihuaiae]
MTQSDAKRSLDRSASAGESEAEAARQVRFEPNHSAGPDGRRKPGDVDASKSRRNPEDDADGAESKSAPGAVAPKDVTTESDDGAG